MYVCIAGPISHETLKLHSKVKKLTNIIGDLLEVNRKCMLVIYLKTNIYSGVFKKTAD